MTDQPYNVLFLCTGNSARSILAEAILKREGHGKFKAFSAGSHPKGDVHPEALRLLDDLGFPTEGYRSKIGTSLRTRERLRSIASLPFATMRREKSVRSGQDSR